MQTSSTPVVCHIDHLPSDLLGWLVDRYLGDGPLVTILVLLFVCRRFRALVTRPRSVTAARLREHQNTAPRYRRDVFAEAGEEACEFGSVSLVRWLCELLRFKPHHSWCSAAAKGGHVALLEWLRSDEVRCEWDPEVVYPIASRHNQRAVLEWVMKQQDSVKLDQQVLWSAARGGHLELVRWLHEEQHVPCDSESVISAALSGNLSLVKYVISTGSPAGSFSLEAAASSGNEALVRYLHEEQHIQWSDDVCAEAASNGHLSLLQWLRSQGCPWGRWTTPFAAARNGHEAVLRWASDNGCSPPSLSEDLLTDVVSRGHVAVLQLLLERYPQAVWATLTPDRYRWCSHLPMFRFLHSIGIKFDKQTLINVITSPSSSALDMVRFLLEETHCDRPTMKELEERRRDIRLDVAEYLQQKGLLKK